jgi:hypothetical protein
VDDDGGRATVTMPGVSPETTGLPEGTADAETEPRDDGWGDEGAGGRSALAGLRSLANPLARGGGGGGPGAKRAGPGASGRIDLRNTWQILVGSILVPLGVVFILLGWAGAAHARVVQQQIPYMVSGAFVGVGCMVLGGLLYWAHWLYRIYDQADLHHEEQLRALEQALRAIAERTGPANSVLAGGAAAEATPSGGHGSAPPGGYVMTSFGSVYHLPDCPVVAHHPEGLRPLAPGESGGLEPCRICLSSAR